MIDKQTGLWIYNKMNEIRDFEETAWTLFTENKLRGSVHLYTGEEAVAASVCAQLTDEDLIASTKCCIFSLHRETSFPVWWVLWRTSIASFAVLFACSLISLSRAASSCTELACSVVP